MHAGPDSSKRSSPAKLCVALIVSLLVVLVLTGCQSNSPEGAVSKYQSALQGGNWKTFKATVVPQNFTETQDALAKSVFEQQKVKFEGVKTKTEYDKNDKNKATVVMTDGKVTVTANIGGKPTTQTMSIKKLGEPERTYQTVRINGVWVVDTKLG